jgi:aspartyl-tRNA(Asn)/glutamyl-tRNA(Gln) amidotransferase subunit C
MISKEQVEYLAKLVRIDISDEEKSAIGQDLSKILDYVKKLDEIDIKDVKPTAHAIEAVNDARADVGEKESAGEEIHERRDILDSFPEEEKGHLKIKEVFE